MPPGSARAYRRRRLAALGVVAVAFGLGAAVGAGGEEGSPPPRIGAAVAPVVPLPAAQRTARAPVDRLPLERQVGKLVVVSFNGTAAPPYVREVLRRGWASGAILFRRNIAAPAQLRALTRALRAAGRAGGATPIVCADQEGGDIRSVAWAPPAVAPAAQRAGPDARAAGAALRALGVNVALAPVADVPSVAGAALTDRTFASDPQRVSAAVAAAVRGWLRAGVAPTAKHFPGLGAATVNTDVGPATIGAGAPTSADLAPFRAAIRAGVPLVMASHAVYPALDGDRIASQSPAALRLLRGRLGFRGVVMTDGIEAAAVRARGSTEQAAVRSVRAGADIVLTTRERSWARAYRALLSEARRSPSFRARVRESAARVLSLQGTLG